MSSQNDGDTTQPAKKRRRVRKPRESIYVKPDPTPYTPAIRPLKTVRSRPSQQDVPALDEIEASGSSGNPNGGESSSMAIERARSKNEKYRARAMKAWDTKRRKQQDRFEALESNTWNGESHTSMVPH